MVKKNKKINQWLRLDFQPLIILGMLKRDFLLGTNFVLGANASGAQLQVLRLAFDSNGSGMNIRIEAPVSMSFRMAYVMSVSRYFPTNFTLQGNNSLLNLSLAICKLPCNNIPYFRV
jgi:hypothetical protein